MNQDSTTPVTEADETAPADAANDAAEVKAAYTPEVTVLLARIEEYKDGWQRERADFANYKRRAEREQSEARNRGSHDAIMKMVPIIDDFERALNLIPDDLKGSSWISGIELLVGKFGKLLTDFQVEIHDPTGQPFDPTKHEAIGLEEKEGVPSGHVTSTLQKGYISGDRVLRPALVRVAQ
ncbi:MAG: nucleotide exchange factor GrpE [Chloroflexi bacterium]|nr:nucleotide exchange factor GrpE [Chloroflexota bacterium]